MRNKILILLSVIIGAYTTASGESATKSFLQSLCKGREYPIAINQSDSYPWEIYSQYEITATNRQDDPFSKSWFSATVYVPGDSATAKFNYNVVYHKMYGGWIKFANLNVYVDDELKLTNNGTDSYQTATLSIPNGIHTIKWELKLNGMIPANYVNIATISNLQLNGISDEAAIPQYNKINVPFYNCKSNELKQDTISVYNAGTEPLIIEKIKGLNYPFSILEGNNSIIPAGETGNIIVGFQPEYEGYYESNMTIVTNGGEQSMKVNGISSTGYVVVSPKPGNLSSVLKNTSYESITIMGHLNQKDQYFFSKLQKCRVLDLSGTDIEVITNGGINNLWKLQTIILPSSLKILDTTWTNISHYDEETKKWLDHYALTTIQCLSTTPPKVYDYYSSGGTSDEKEFGNLYPSTKLLVPETSISEYSANPIWNKLTILPSNNIRSTLKVKLDVDDPSDYSGMSLILENQSLKNSQSITLNGNSEYSFIGLQNHHKYRVVLKDQNDRTLGESNNIEPEEPEIAITLSGIKNVFTIGCSVLDKNNNDVTADVMVEWIDEKGKILSNNPTLKSVLSGDSIICRTILPKTLGSIYINPPSESLRIADRDSTMILQLKEISDIEIHGIIKDAVYKKPIANASILFTQYLNSKYQTTKTVKTDENGCYSIILKNDSTIVSVSAPDYIAYEKKTDNLNNPAVLNDLFLQPQKGVVVSLQFTYQPCSKPDKEPVIENWFYDYNNVVFNAVNKTTGKKIEQLDYRWPHISLLENCSIGDSIAITAESKTDIFYPSEAICVIDSLGQSSAIIPIIELGAICSSYNYSDNQSTIGLLFDSNLKLIANTTYSSSTAEFKNLKDGKHTLVTIGANNYYNAIPTLLSLHEYGLKENIDYVLTDFDIKSGKTSVVNYDSIPSFNADSHRLTGSGTHFTSNKSSVIAGGYITIDSKIDFIPSVKDKVKNIKLIIDIPENVSFVKNSLLLGGSSSDQGVSFNGNKLTIPLKSSNDKIRFCLQPTTYGNYITSGTIKFDVDNSEICQPIGKVSFSASSITLSVPSVTPYKEVMVNGQTSPNSVVTIFDNHVPVGKTTASGNGNWQTKITLDNAYNLSHHQIHAKITTSNGTEMLSESKDLLYDKNRIAVEKVTMYHDNPEVGKTFSVVFDFINPSPITSSYTYYIYNKNFTFTIDLTDNNPERVKNVVLWVKTGKGNEVALDAEYDENQCLWVASGQFGNMYDGDIPANVSVSISQEPVVEIDDDELTQLWKKYQSQVEDNKAIDKFYAELQNQLELLQNSENNDSSAIKSIMLQALHGIDLDFNDIPEYIDSPEDIETILDEFERQINDLEKYVGWIPKDIYESHIINYGEHSINFSISPYREPESLQGDCIKLKTTKNNELTIITSDISQTIYDPYRNYILKVEYIDGSVPQSRNATSGKSDDRNWLSDIINTLSSNITTAATTKFLQSMYEQEFQELSDQAILTALKMPRTSDKSSWVVNFRKILNLRKAAEAAKAVGNAINAASKCASILSETTAGLWEHYRFLQTASDRMPKLYDCAIQKYPGESADVLETLTELISGSPKIVKQKATLSVCGQGGAAATSIIAGTIGNAVSEKISTTQWNQLNKCIDAINALNSTCVKEERQRLIDEGWFESNCPDAPNQIDPSGYVFETVPSNRLQGVKATCYQKVKTENMYGDIIEKAVIWNSGNFGQKNPLYTDKQGLYRWDVPEGLWQVKFEKEGYETAYTEWLPVPPPQLDINVPMVQYTQPDVVSAEWTEKGVEISFNKYMLPITINQRNISVELNGRDISGKIEFCDEESTEDDSDESYVSSILVTLAEQPDKKEFIDVTVKGNIKSYAGIPIGVDRSFRLSQVPTVTEYITADHITMTSGESITLPIAVKSVEAAAKKQIIVTNSSPIIAAVNEQAIVDEQGNAYLNIQGLMPGATNITIKTEGYSLTKQIPVTVISPKNKKVKQPYSSLNDISCVNIGSEIYLYCDTEDATIFYTTDGSCPCDYINSKRYDGQPIVINDNTELRIIACKPGFDDSEISIYNYIVSTDDISETIYCKYDIFPHRTADYVYLNTNGEIASRVIVTTADGKVVQSETGIPDKSRINLSHLPDGIYFVSMIINNQNITQKIVKI